jgi:Family of unknown function (DUF5522)
MHPRKTQDDWEITTDGLYIATRGFLIRRGICCANRCRNCPYINWRLNDDWQPIPTEYIRKARIASRSVVAARKLLEYHQEQLALCESAEQDRHQKMVAHYTALLERWTEKKISK